ncbi:hypothetical protein ACUNED_24410, partial [Serratia sp. IR-2025]
ADISISRGLYEPEMATKSTTKDPNGAEEGDHQKSTETGKGKNQEQAQGEVKSEKKTNLGPSWRTCKELRAGKKSEETRRYYRYIIHDHKGRIVQRTLI